AIYDGNKLITGRIEVTNNERHCTFYPDESWKPGKYLLDIETDLEDRAGNNLIQPFDNDLKKSRNKEITPRFFTIQ
ncbi:MAG TPA: hypothetical protein VHM26_09510, partial [Chitinophagaceae bacterium]|nr:hypothetical protein [Chitinophagaceae bacterium]